jgi:hypothetical protein
MFGEKSPGLSIEQYVYVAVVHAHNTYTYGFENSLSEEGIYIAWIFWSRKALREGTVMQKYGQTTLWIKEKVQHCKINQKMFLESQVSRAQHQTLEIRNQTLENH